MSEASLPESPWLLPEEAYTDAELAAFGEFTSELAAGRPVSVEEFLGRYPEHAGALRPALEAAAWFGGMTREFKREFPGFSTWELFGLVHRR